MVFGMDERHWVSLPMAREIGTTLRSRGAQAWRSGGTDGEILNLGTALLAPLRDAAVRYQKERRLQPDRAYGYGLNAIPFN